MHSSTNSATSAFTSTLASAPQEIGKNFAIKLSGSSSSTDLPVMKEVVAVQVYQLFTAPETRSSMRFGRLVATNGVRPGALPISSVGSFNEGALGPNT